MDLTREHLEKLYTVYWWLAEAGEEYIEQANIIRDIYYFCQNLLDVEEGITQGYLSADESAVGQTFRTKA